MPSSGCALRLARPHLSGTVCRMPASGQCGKPYLACRALGRGNKDLAELRALRIGAAELDFLDPSPQKKSPSPFTQAFEVPHPLSTGHQQQGCSNWAPLCQPIPRPNSRLMLQSLGDSFLVARLAVKLYLYLGLGWRWSSSALRLILYAVLLLPGFAQVRFCACSNLLTFAVLASARKHASKTKLSRPQTAFTDAPQPLTWLP